MRKQAYLVIEGKVPTIHVSEKEANNFVGFVRQTDKAHKKLKAMFCMFSPKDFNEGFCNCIWKSI